MKAILLTGVALAALVAGPAMAADLPYKAPALKATPPAPVFSWTGFYLGGHAGGAWSTVDWTWDLPTLFIPTERRANDNGSGFVGGGHAGFNWQTGNWVWGLEASWTSGIRDREVINFLGFSRDFVAKVDSIFLGTAHLGWAMDRWMIYAKGGVANADVRLDTFRTDIQLHQTTSKKREYGWTAGAGAQYALTNNLIFGVEYNYIGIDPSDRLNVEIPSTFQSNHHDIDVKIHQVLGRLSWKFD